VFVVSGDHDNQNKIYCELNEIEYKPKLKEQVPDIKPELKKTGSFIHYVSTDLKEKISESHSSLLIDVHEKWVNKISNWIDNKVGYPTSRDYLEAYQNIIQIVDECNDGVEFIFKD